MRVRPLLYFTAIISSIIGAAASYVALTVPNDIAGERLLRSARGSITAGDPEGARASLKRVLMEYPRTDAAAAATLALIEISHHDEQTLKSQTRNLQNDLKITQRQIAQLTAQLGVLASKPATPEVAAAPGVIAAPTVPKPSPKARTKRRRRRRH